MARRRRDEDIAIKDVLVEENTTTEENEKPAEKIEIEAEIKKATKKGVIKITAPRVNIRKTPSLLGEVKKIAVAGDKFAFINDGADGFYEISCDNEIAYVMKDFAELMQEV